MNQIATARQHRIALALCVLLGVALVGGTVGSWVYRSLRQRWAVEQMGGEGTRNLGIGIFGLDHAIECIPDGVEYDYQLGEDLTEIAGDPPGPQWLRERLGIDFLATVRGAGLCTFPEKRIQAIQALTGLRNLVLSGQGPEFAAALLPRFPELERLVLYGDRVDDDTVALLASLPHLRILRLIGTRITDRGVAEIARIATLRELMLIASSEITEAGLEQLGQLTHLERLSLNFNGERIDAALEQLQSLKELNQLVLYNSAGKSSEGLKFLAELPELTKLGISGDDQMVTDDWLATLPELPNLETLALISCPKLHAPGLAKVAKLRHLESLKISNTPGLDDACLEHLRRLPNLTRLSIDGDGTALTEQGIAQLAELKHLRQLDITLHGSTRTISTAIEAVGKKLPDCAIRFNK